MRDSEYWCANHFSDPYLVYSKVAAVAIVALMSASVVGCAALPNGQTTVTNRTSTTIRISGSCTPDDASPLGPGEIDSDVYRGSQCRIDDRDGLKGMLGCVALKSVQTDITAADIQRPPGPDECWGAGRQ